MKKAFPFKKRLSAVLAVVLAVAAAAGTAPANAQDKTYAYSTIGNYGSFEEYMWSIGDDTNKAYKLSFATVDGESGVPVVTKTGADGNSPFAKLNTRQILLTAGAKYQVSFKIKSADASTKGWFKLMGIKYTADSAQSNEIKYSKVAINGNNAVEAYLSDAWSDCTAEFTADASYPLSEFRIWIQGNKGTQITVKDFDVREIKAQAKYNEAATLDNWDHQDTNPALSYNNPGLDDCKIEPVAEGYNGDYGALRFYKKSYGTALHICQMIENDKLLQYATGTVFVFEANVKCDFINDNDDKNLSVSIEGSPFSWTEGDAKVWNINEGTTYGWKKITKEMKKDDVGHFYLLIKTGGYLLTDFYVDNIKLYAKNDTTETNLLSNGDFRQNKPETTLEDWDNIGYGYEDPDASYADLTLSEDGYSNPGSVRFYSDYAVNSKAENQKIAAIAYCLKNTEAGKKYILEAYVKGCTKDGGADPLFAEFLWGHGKWTDGVPGSEKDLRFNAMDSDDWVKISYEFTVVDIGWVPFKIYSGGYSGVDCYIDDIKVYPEGEPETNLISNSTFCETESVISEESAIDNSPYTVQNVPGFDIGMLNNNLDGNKELSVVPGGSYDGSTAVQFKVVHTGSDDDKAERYFQQNDGVKFVLGDTSIKATGYFKVTEGNTEPKIWLGFGKKYNDKDSVGLHFAEYLSGEQANGESFTDIGDGWYYFEKTVDTSTFNNMIKSLSELVYVKYMCGIDARKKAGTALFDNVTCEIVSSAKPGDTNNDGDIDIRDLVHMKKYAAGTVKFTDMTRGTWLSDIGYNESPSITNEMVCMRKYLIGASSEYGK